MPREASFDPSLVHPNKRFRQAVEPAQKSHGIYLRWLVSWCCCDPSPSLSCSHCFGRFWQPDQAILSDWVVEASSLSSRPLHKPDAVHGQFLSRWALPPSSPTVTHVASQTGNFCSIRWVTAHILKCGWPFKHYAAVDTSFLDVPPLSADTKAMYLDNIAHVDSIHIFARRNHNSNEIVNPYSTTCLIIVARPEDCNIVRRCNNVGTFTHEECVMKGHVFTPNGRLHGTHTVSVAATVVPFRSSTQSDNIVVIVSASCVMYLRGNTNIEDYNLLGKCGLPTTLSSDFASGGTGTNREGLGAEGRRKGASDNFDDKKFRRFMFGSVGLSHQWAKVVEQGLKDHIKPKTNHNNVHSVDGVSIMFTNLPISVNLGSLANTIFYTPISEWKFPINCHFSAQVVLDIDKNAFMLGMVNRNTTSMATPFPSLFRTTGQHSASNFDDFYVSELCLDPYLQFSQPAQEADQDQDYVGMASEPDHADFLHVEHEVESKQTDENLFVDLGPDFKSEMDLDPTTEWDAWEHSHVPAL